jgi:hypothetical protein
VISGSEWGNMLLWEGGKIKCEIACKGKKGGSGPEPIHAGGIDVILIEDGEVVTAGADGHIRIWDLDVVDLADAPSETDMVFTMDAQLERKVSFISTFASVTVVTYHYLLHLLLLRCWCAQVKTRFVLCCLGHQKRDSRRLLSR